MPTFRDFQVSPRRCADTSLHQTSEQANATRPYNRAMAHKQAWRHVLPMASALTVALAVTDAHAIFIVNQPWVRVAANGNSAEAYMDLTSTEGATLVGARSMDAGVVAIHTRGNRLAPKSELALPAGSMIKLSPGGYRLAMRSLTRPLKLGDRVGLTLTIQAPDGKQQEIPVNAEIRRRSPIEDELRAHRH